MANSQTKSAALEYAALGWPVFPVRHDKSPHTPNGVLDATTDREQVEKWWDRWPGANVALAAGDAGLLVLDYDPGNDPDEVRHAVPDLPETRLVARTPRGGEHHYYALDPGDPPVASRTRPFAEHVDVRSFHGYVLLPPSRTCDGAYEWASRGRPAHRSEGLLAACGKARERSDDADEWCIEPDLPENVKLARAWLRSEVEIGSSRCRPAVEGAGGDNTTYATAAMMKSCGLSEGTALEVMWEEYNPRCSPPWDYEDLARKVENGYRYNTSPPGNVTPAYHVARVAGLFEPAVTSPLGDGREVKSGRFRFVDGPGLTAVRPPEWLVPGAIPEDAYVLLSGRTGSYKTFVTVDLAMTVATGGGALSAGEWPGLWAAPRRPGPVLFAVGEGRAGLRQRAEAWMLRHHGDERVPPEFVLADPVPHVSEGTIEAFVEGALKLHPGGYRLVVLDTVSRAMYGMNTSADENATAFTQMTEALRRELGCTVVALHHTGHGDQERARGSSAFLGDPDTLLMLHWVERELARLGMTKQKEWEAWDTPLWARMERVTLSGGRETLVALATEPPARLGRDLGGQVTLRLVDQFVVDFLRSHPLEEFSDSALASRLVYHELETEGGDKIRLDLREGTLRRDGPTGLKTLRAPGSGALSQPMYDPAKGRWRYSPPAASDFDPTTAS